jgi:hypothetical protein
VVGDHEPVVTNPQHPDLIRIGVIDCRYGVSIACQKDRKSFFDETGRLRAAAGESIAM